MKTTVKVQLSLTGLKYITGNSFAKRIDDAVGKTAKDTIKDIQKTIKKPKRGQVIPGKKRKRRGAGGAVVSAPGEAPANQLGNLVESMYANRVALFTWEMGSTSPIAYYLEYGTVNKLNMPKMAARPFFWKGVQAGVKNLKVNVTVAFTKIPEAKTR